MLRTILATLFLLQSLIAHADTLQGRVVGVTDGDTITVLDSSKIQYKIRLSGIDAPEKRQPFGQVSKKSLSDLIFGKTVVVDWQKRDRYERIVGKVLLDNEDVNLKQVKRGLAWHYSKYKKEQPLEDRLLYLHAEEAARDEKVGLWVEPSPVAPWDWRKQ